MGSSAGIGSSLTRASVAAAQRAAEDFTALRAERAVVESGLAVESAAKAIVAAVDGPTAVFVSKDLTEHERWLIGDAEISDEQMPAGVHADEARAAFLARETISARKAINKAQPSLEAPHRGTATRAAHDIMASRNSSAHLGRVAGKIGDLADTFLTAIEPMWTALHLPTDQWWGCFRAVARRGALGRRDTWQLDRDARLALACEHAHAVGVVGLARRRQVVYDDVRANCPACGSAARYNPHSRELPPSVVNANEDGTVALLDCIVCGLTLWGPQIGEPDLRVG